MAAMASAGESASAFITWLKSNYGEQLRMAELAQRAGMSVSSLRHHFKAVSAMTPVQDQTMHADRRLCLIGLCFGNERLRFSDIVSAARALQGLRVVSVT